MLRRALTLFGSLLLGRLLFALPNGGPDHGRDEKGLPPGHLPPPGQREGIAADEIPPGHLGPPGLREKDGEGLSKGRDNRGKTRRGRREKRGLLDTIKDRLRMGARNAFGKRGK
jgi:hypothetical protein